MAFTTGENDFFHGLCEVEITLLYVCDFVIRFQKKRKEKEYKKNISQKVMQYTICTEQCELSWLLKIRLFREKFFTQLIYCFKPLVLGRCI